MKKKILSWFLVVCMVLGMLPVTALAAEIPDGVNFSSISDAQSITAGETISFSLWGMEYSAPSYTVTVPEGTETVTVTFASGADVCTPYTNSSGVLRLSGCKVTYNEENGTYSASGTESDCINSDGVYTIELDVATMIENGQMYGGYSSSYTVLYLLGFAYGEAEDTGSGDSGAPFLSISIGGKELDDDSIVSKGPFDLGDMDGDDSYNYIHEDVPYYHVTVPCGTEYVDVTYGEDTVILTSGSTAYGYATELTVDAVSSATVKGRTFKDAYTKNEDGTQTVKTPVTGYTFDEDGNGMAITLESDGNNSFEAVCLFTFEYDKQNHVYAAAVTAPTCTEGGYTTYTCTCGDSYIADQTEAAGHSYADGVCTVCGEADPDYQETDGAVIPEGAPFVSVTTDAEGTVTVNDQGAVDFGYYSGISYYHVELPEGATEVYVTYSADITFYLYNDAAYAYSVSVPEYEMGYASGSFATVGNDDGTRTVTIPVENFLLEDGTGKGIALEDTNWNPVNLFTFELPAGSGAEHTHSYEAVVTAPTCTEGGYTTYTCSCGDSYIADETAATGHSYTATVTAPTCTEGGYTTYTCTCGDAYTTDETAATGHSYENGACTVCGEKDPDYVDVNAPEQDENGVYQLATADNLMWFAETVNGGETAISAVLTADIDLTGKEWSGIGTSSNKFAGSFDGQNHTVTFDGAACGLFAYVRGTSSQYAEVKNVTVAGTISGNSKYVGGIIGVAAYTNVSNCVNRADITSSGITGGIVGYAIPNIGVGYLNVTNCGNEGDITTTDGAAGIVGSVQTAGVITGCYNTGNISGAYASAYSGVGGIVGYLQGYKGASSVTDCYNAGTISGSGTVGGLVGSQMNETKIVNCYNAGTAPYAVAGKVHNGTNASVSNTYYLDTASTEAVPASDLFDSVVVVAKTHEEMRADDFAATLGESWQTSCPYPVQTWQTAVAHDYVKGVCSVCQAEDPNYIPEAEEPAQVDGIYQIGTAEELFWFAAHVNEGNTTASAVLTADIDLDNASWTSIGTADAKFAGSFDGQNHKVENLYGANGLFGTVEGTSDTNAVIKNVMVTGTITGVADCVGGIVGNAKYATIENCVNMAAVSSAYNYVGGIVGLADSCAITACGNEGTVVGARDTGGIVGQDRFGPVTNCWNHAAVSSTSSNVGGIVGELVQNNSIVTGCYNKGMISGNNYAGGIAGYAKKPLVDCYNWGTVISTGKYAGGVAAYLGYIGGGVKNCYNAGFVTGGGAFGRSPLGNESENCYYLEGTASTTADKATVKTAEEMKSADFVTTMGDAFKQGSLYPILSWQADEAAITAYAVTIPEETGYTVMGPELAIAGEDYSFSVTIMEGYLAGENFAVQVNGETVTGTNGIYTVENVSGALTITVTGVELEPAAIFTVTLPETGNGYRVESVEGYDAASVVAKTDYKFTVSFASGFKAGESFTVKANDVALTAVDGVYTIEAVTENQTITVSGVEMIPCEDTVTVNLTVTYGEKQFYVPEDFDDFIMLEDLEIPYFDLALYGLEKYYYDPDCYTGSNQTAGNPETAYGVVTLIHTFIYVTEVYYLGYDVEDAGKGLSHQTDTDKDGISDFDEVLSWTGGVGSSFMNLWGHGTNLNYYINYEYPLGAPAWGSTSDQEALEDGDVVSMHLIEDPMVSGSNFSFFTVNDEDGNFTQEDTTDSITVKQGDEVQLTLYWTGNGGNYTTKYDAIPGWNLYWIEEENVTHDIRDWNTTEFAGFAEGELVTGSDGTITLDTTDLEPGTYYIGSLGGKTAGGTDNGDGFISRGGETGPGVFKLVVEAGEGGDSGDTGDTTVIPEGAPFISITTDVEGTVTVIDQGAVDFGSYSGISYYHVELPEGATEVYVTYSADINFYLYNDAAYAYKISVPDFGFGYAPGSYATVANDDGTRTVTIPIEKFLLTDGSGNGIALEDTNWNPVNLFTFSYAESEEPEIMLGDIDGNGIINILDANLAASYYNEVIELTDAQIAAADVNGDGIVNILDANLIAAYYNEVIDSFPAEN